jgi:hypothetical protein
LEAREGRVFKVGGGEADVTSMPIASRGSGHG